MKNSEEESRMVGAYIVGMIFGTLLGYILGQIWRFK